MRQAPLWSLPTYPGSALGNVCLWPLSLESPCQVPATLVLSHICCVALGKAVHLSGLHQVPLHKRVFTS